MRILNLFCGRTMLIFMLTAVTVHLVVAANDESARFSGSKPKFSVATPNAAPTPVRTATSARYGALPMPSAAIRQSLVKTTLLKFDEALAAEDFTDFYGTICKPWQQQTTPDALKLAFKDFLDRQIRIGAIKTLKASFTPAPVIETVLGYRTLKLLGQYNTRPQLVKFELSFIPEGRRWKLSKIVVDTTVANSNP